MAPAVDNTDRQLERQRVDRLGTPVQIAASVPLIVYNFGQFSVVQDVRSDSEVRSLEMGRRAPSLTLLASVHQFGLRVNSCSLVVSSGNHRGTKKTLNVQHPTLSSEDRGDQASLIVDRVTGHFQTRSLDEHFAFRILHFSLEFSPY